MERMLARALGGALGGGAIAFTLMACYGMPPCPDGSLECYDDEADASARNVTRPDIRVRDAAADADDGADAGDDSDDAGDGDPDAGDGDPDADSDAD